MSLEAPPAGALRGAVAGVVALTTFAPLFLTRVRLRCDVMAEGNG